jgi:hypothetical protein
MANQDTSKDVDTSTTEDEEIETSMEEDDTSTDEKDTTADDTEDSDDDDSDEDDDESETEDDEDKFEKRFTQFKGETFEEYTPQLEKAYGEALAEMTRQKQANKQTQAQIDAVRAAVAKDADFAKKLDELMGDEAQEVTVDPALLEIRQNREAQMDKDYKAFVDLHPEMESDPQLQEEVLSVLEDFGAQARKRGKILTMAEALRKSWLYLGKDDTTEKVAIKAKEVAAKSKTGNSAKKSAKKQDFTEEQLRIAKKWNLTPEQLAASTKSSK